MLSGVPSGVHGTASGPYLRIVLAEFVDVGISEHTGNVCAMPHERPDFSTGSTENQSFSALHEPAVRGAVTVRRPLEDSLW